MMTRRPTCFELRAGLERVAMPYWQFAVLCGVSEGTVGRWCEGRLPIPRYAWIIFSLYMGMAPEEVIEGKLYRFDIVEADVFPEGYSREEYVRLMRRFHPDQVRHKRTRDFLGEVQILNEIKEAKRQEDIASGRIRRDRAAKKAAGAASPKA